MNISKIMLKIAQKTDVLSTTGCCECSLPTVTIKKETINQYYRNSKDFMPLAARVNSFFEMTSLFTVITLTKNQINCRSHKSSINYQTRCFK